MTSGRIAADEDAGRIRIVLLSGRNSSEFDAARAGDMEPPFYGAGNRPEIARSEASLTPAAAGLSSRIASHGKGLRKASIGSRRREMTLFAPAPAPILAAAHEEEAPSETAECLLKMKLLTTAAAAMAILSTAFLVAPATVGEANAGGRVIAGPASWYGPGFQGRRTANGERFDQNAMTAAHRTLPFGTKVRVTCRNSGRSVTVRINDRGPFHGNRVIDLSRAAASEIGIVGRGVGPVSIEVLA